MFTTALVLLFLAKKSYIALGKKITKKKFLEKNFLMLSETVYLLLVILLFLLNISF